MGYRFLAKNSSEQTHEIPIEGFELAEKDYRLVLSELERFLCPDGTQLPPVFAKVLNLRERWERALYMYTIVYVHCILLWRA